MGSEQTVVEKLQEALQPKGTAFVVRLFYDGYTEKDFVDACLKELDDIILGLSIIGEEPTPLQKLAIKVLIKSSYLPLENLIK